MRVLVGVILFLCVGCASPPPPAPLPSLAVVPEVVLGHVNVQKIPFALGPGLDVAGAEATGVASGTFQVTAGANDLYAEARWSCSVPLCDLVLDLRDGANGTQGQAIGTGHASIRLTGPGEGAWNASVGAANVLVDARGEIRVSLFYNVLVDPAYTAFPR